MTDGGIRMPRHPPAHDRRAAAVVAGAQHRRECQQAHQGHRGADDAGGGGEQGACGQRGNRQRTGHAPNVI